MHHTVVPIVRVRFLFLVLAFTALLITQTTSLLSQTTGKVEGFIHDVETGEPLQGVQVKIEGTLLGNISDGEGDYFIHNVPVGLRSEKDHIIG